MSGEDLNRPPALVDALDAVIGGGVRVDAEIRISVAGVDLIFLGLKALLCPADEADRWRLEAIEKASLRAPDAAE